MGRPSKTREEVDVTYFLANRGSRWRAVLDKRGILDATISAFEIVLADMPEFKYYRVHYLLDSEEWKEYITNERVTIFTEDIVTMLYTQYFEHEEEILSAKNEVVGLTPAPEVAIPEENITIPLVNSTYSNMLADKKAYERDIVDVREKALKLLHNYEEAISEVKQYATKVEDIDAVLNNMDAKDLVSEYNIFDIHKSICEAASKYNAIVLGASYGVASSVKSDDSPRAYQAHILFRSREIHNPDRYGMDNSSAYTQPIVMTLVGNWERRTIVIKNEPRVAATNIKWTIEFNHNIQFGIDTRAYYSSVVHPHVAASPCWGDQQETVLDALRNNDFDTVFNRFDALLGEYNSGSPYSSWNDFMDLCSFDTHIHRFERALANDNALPKCVSFMKVAYGIYGLYHTARDYTYNNSYQANSTGSYHVPLAVPEYSVEDMLGSRLYGLMREFMSKVITDNYYLADATGRGAIFSLANFCKIVNRIGDYRSSSTYDKYIGAIRFAERYDSFVVFSLGAIRDCPDDEGNPSFYIDASSNARWIVDKGIGHYVSMEFMAGLMDKANELVGYDFVDMVDTYEKAIRAGMHLKDSVSPYDMFKELWRNDAEAKKRLEDDSCVMPYVAIMPNQVRKGYITEDYSQYSYIVKDIVDKEKENETSNE